MKSTTETSVGSVPFFRKARPRWREFSVAINNTEVYHHGGIGLTPDDVIAELQESYRKAWENDVGGGMEAPGTYGDDWDQFVIWEGRRVIAVVTAAPNARPELAATRFDGAAPPVPDADQVGADAAPPLRQSGPSPRPFLRQTMTIVPPWDADGSVTIEVVVVHGGYGSGASDAFPDCPDHEGAFPALSEAGWSRRQQAGTTVFTRVVG